MEAATQHGIASRLTAGRLEGISVPDLFWSLCTARATGVLHLTSGSVGKRVYFSEGRITFAASNDPNDRLGEMLLRQGAIRLEHFERAVARLTEGRRLGAILVESGQLAPESLVKGVLDQVRNIVSSLLPLEAGDYWFDEGPLPTEEIVTLEIGTAPILLSGMRSIRSFQHIRRSVGLSNTRYRAVEGWRESVAGLEMTDGELQLLERLEGAGESVERLCSEVFLSNFEIYQALWTFKVLGIARECTPEVGDSAADSLTEGRLGRDGIGQVLVRLSRAVETGVLQVTRGGAERSFHLREGRLVFATSNNIDDGLVTYLLRRGMISLRDREETSRRLLSNKRVGQILLEMNVIEQDELAKLVREHQTEILFDTFRWEDAAWVWLPGELPTIESIVLDRTIEDVVFSGIRRVSSWPRVREGCGGLTTRLGLTPNYLQVLDRMNVAADDWDLVTTLRTPTTPLELCRVLALGDFRVCQTLWALRILGAVDEAPLEDALEAAIGSIGTLDDDTCREEKAPVRHEPEVEPEPIAPTAVDAEASFEVTTVHEMMPKAEASDQTVPASTWSEPSDDTRPPWAWKPSGDTQAVELSNAGEAAEVISEHWRFAADDLGPAPVDSPNVTNDAAPDASGAESSFAIVPKEDDSASADSVLDAVGPAVSALFQVPPPELEARNEFGMDLPGKGPDSAEIPETDAPERPSNVHSIIDRDETDAMIEKASVADPVDGGLDDTSDSAGEALETILRDEAEAESDTPESALSVRETEGPRFETESGTELPESAALRGSDISERSVSDPSVGMEPLPPWNPPPELDLEIAHFVERHKAVFRVIRSEVGAGAMNFVRSFHGAMGDGIGEILAEAVMQSDGAWDVGDLRRMICERRVADAPDAFRSLIEREVGALRAQIGERRTRALLEQIDAL